MQTRQEILTVTSDGEEPPHFHAEFGRFMLEATPGQPWGIGFKDLLKVESNMKWRWVAGGITLDSSTGRSQLL